MEEFISKSASFYAEFLKNIDPQLKRNQGQSLVSFIFPADKIDMTAKLDGLCKRQEILFYSEKPSEKTSLFGKNSILTITEKGEKRFASLDKKMKESRENFISNKRDYENLYVPLFMGGMKFTVEHSDEDWKDFDDSIWFIPELIYISNAGEYYFVFNALISSKIKLEPLLAKFENALKPLFVTPAAGQNKNLRILKKSGNEPKDKKKWKNQVNRVLEKIEDGNLQKLVLSRKVELVFTMDILIEPIINSLVENYPECTLFLYHIGKSSFIGASPETLAVIKDNEMHMEILAGSADRGTDMSDDQEIETNILNNEKNINEHNLVVNYIKESLQNSVENIEISQPSVKKLLNIQHLRSTVDVHLNGDISFINVIGKIHPTPSVCGLPKDVALNSIKKIEDHQRGLYAGLIGWFNLQNEGEFVLAIRSSLVVGNKLNIYAGCGIVQGSNPDEEFKETELKLKPFLGILNNEH